MTRHFEILPSNPAVFGSPKSADCSLAELRPIEAIAVYLSFPSAQDPDFQPRHPGKSTVEARWLEPVREQMHAVTRGRCKITMYRH